MRRLSAGRRLWTGISLASPLVYFLLYLPVWGGRELVNSSAFTNGMLLFQGLCFLLALGHLLTALFLPRRLRLEPLFDALAAASLLWTCFACLIFTLELAGVPWFPAQG